jgi:hypothetical protein
LLTFSSDWLDNMNQIGEEVRRNVEVLGWLEQQIANLYPEAKKRPFFKPPLSLKRYSELTTFNNLRQNIRDVDPHNPHPVLRNPDLLEDDVSGWRRSAREGFVSDLSLQDTVDPFTGKTRTHSDYREMADVFYSRKHGRYMGFESAVASDDQTEFHHKVSVLLAVPTGHPNESAAVESTGGSQENGREIRDQRHEGEVLLLTVQE